jgi:putative NADPH-quinone reductase
MRKIMIVVGHPQCNTLCEALGKAYQGAAQAAGHDATLFRLADMKFDPILHDGYRQTQVLEPDLQAAYDALSGCDHLVLMFPLWCGDMPALMKGFIERILQPDLIARENTENAMNWSIFKNKTARIVMTMGMPVSIYRFWYGGHALKLLSRNILNFIGIKPVRHTLFGMVGTSKPQTRDKWVEQVRQLGREAA